MTPTPRLEARALITDLDQVMLVRAGRGRAGGSWSLPGGEVQPGESLAECVVRHLETLGMEALCGPFVDWAERISDDDHTVEMYFKAVLLSEPTVDDLAPAVETTEARMIAVWDVPELRLAAGVLDILADQEIVDVVV